MLGETLSWIFGLGSTLLWVGVFIPQIKTNYENGSIEALSFYLLLAWFIGNVLSFMGATGLQLDPNVIYVAVFHIVFNLIFLGQWFYYHLESDETISSTQENTPLLARNLSYSRDIIEKILKVPEVIVFVIGCSVCLLLKIALSFTEESVWLSAAIAWLATAIFLVSRLPQIYLNSQRQSTQGLSLMAFIFAFAANKLMLLAILIRLINMTNAKQQSDYLIKNSPWMIGLAGTGIFDIVIFVQFYLYQDTSNI
jgi:uncharacterized protein with PQ loop repeat